MVRAKIKGPQASKVKLCMLFGQLSVYVEWFFVKPWVEYLIYFRALGFVALKEAFRKDRVSTLE